MAIPSCRSLGRGGRRGPGGGGGQGGVKGVRQQPTDWTISFIRSDGRVITAAGSSLAASIHCNPLAVLQVFEGKATLKQLAQNWTVSYIGNFVGSLLMVAIICGCATFPLQAPNVLQMVGPKVALTFNQVITPVQPA